MPKGGKGLKRRRKLNPQRIKRICVDVDVETYSKLAAMGGRCGFGHALDQLVKRLIQYQQS
jgi:hypothetical protein